MAAVNPVAELLTRARERISVPERWTTAFYARDAEGRMAALREPDAVCWCAQGALLCEYDSMLEALEGTSFREATQLFNAVVGEDIVVFNDSHTHEEVLAAFDRAIELALELPEEEPTNA